MTAPVPGPFATEQDARRAAHKVIAPEGGSSILSFAQNRQLIRRALDAAGVETSPYEDRALEWLGGWEDTTASVIARWITAAAARKPRTLVIDLSDENRHVYHVVTEALGDYAAKEARLAEAEGGNYQRSEWARFADEIVEAAEAAMEPQAPAAEDAGGM